jgi:hypothetical protein
MRESEANMKGQQMVKRGTDPASRLEQVLREGAWIENMEPVDISTLSGRARSRRLWPLVLPAASVVLIVLGTVVTVGLLDHRGGDGATSGGGVVPWVELPPVHQSESTTSCAADDIVVATGKAGAWHGMTTQQIVLRNTGDVRCELSPREISAAVTTRAGDQPIVDMSGVADAAADLDPGQAAQLQLGTPESCGDTPVTIAHDVSVTLDGGTPVQVSDAWLAIGCADPRALDFLADPTEPATENLSLSASIGDLGPAAGGHPLTFTVTLANHAQTPISFANCPNYLVGLKYAEVSAAHQLNCDDVTEIPSGGSITYAMQIDIPTTTPETDLLTWQLQGYNTSDRADIEVEE